MKGQSNLVRQPHDRLGKNKTIWSGLDFHCSLQGNLFKCTKDAGTSILNGLARQCLIQNNGGEAAEPNPKSEIGQSGIGGEFLFFFKSFPSFLPF